MSLIVGVNSYVDQATATAYYSNRLDALEWDTFTMQDAALITATNLLDSLCRWSGNRTSPAQPLAFPRNGDTIVPENIKTAQLEIAIEMINQGVSSFHTSSNDLSKLKAGSVLLEWSSEEGGSVSVINSLTKSLLLKYGSCSFGGGSINVVNLQR